MICGLLVIGIVGLAILLIGVWSGYALAGRLAGWVARRMLGGDTHFQSHLSGGRVSRSVQFLEGTQPVFGWKTWLLTFLYHGVALTVLLFTIFGVLPPLIALLMPLLFPQLTSAQSQ
jgi:hypothetical protein